VGAHLSGQPLNHELLAAGGVLAGPAVTAPRYRLFALDTTPPKPGLVRVTEPAKDNSKMRPAGGRDDGEADPGAGPAAPRERGEPAVAAARPAADARETGASIAGELWRLPAAGFARFMAGLSAPMAVGRVRLEDGREVLGFVCEPAALAGAADITGYGGWRAWLAR
jgi:allophanate hydrolase